MKFLKLLTLVVVILKLLTNTLSLQVRKNIRARHKIQPPELSFNPIPKEYHTGPQMNFAANTNQHHEVYNRNTLAIQHTYHQENPTI